MFIEDEMSTGTIEIMYIAQDYLPKHTALLYNVLLLYIRQMFKCNMM